MPPNIHSYNSCKNTHPIIKPPIDIDDINRYVSSSNQSHDNHNPLHSNSASNPSFISKHNKKTKIFDVYK